MSETLPDPIDILARTLYGEARGEGQHGMEAVSSVIMNRVRNPRWWGKDVVSVCQKPWQFSCWNENDPNRAKLLAATEKDFPFPTCLQIAASAVAGTLADPTNGADSYYDVSISPPGWAMGKDPVYSLGDLRFFRLELAAP